MCVSYSIIAFFEGSHDVLAYHPSAPQHCPTVPLLPRGIISLNRDMVRQLELPPGQDLLGDFKGPTWVSADGGQMMQCLT